MRIGILTLHSAFNHGAFGQAYSLQQYLSSIGHDPVFINYKNLSYCLKWYRQEFLRRDLNLLRRNLARLKKFKADQKLLRLTPFSFRIRNIRTQRFDAVIIGSDELWNYNAKLRGCDPVYFGSGIKARKIVTYAVSFGQVAGPVDLPSKLCGLLRRINTISVRDENSRELVFRNAGLKPPVVLDPVFLADFTGKEAPCPHEDFILVYADHITKNDILRVQDLSKQLKKRLISVAFYHPWCHMNVTALSFFELLGYFQAASVVVSTTFHGSVFAIKYRKNFCVMPDFKYPKVETMMRNLSLAGQMVTDPKCELISKFQSPVDYKETDVKLREWSERSKGFLKEALG